MRAVRCHWLDLWHKRELNLNLQIHMHYELCGLNVSFSFFFFNTFKVILVFCAPTN